MNIQNLKNSDITFPIKIPIRYKYVYKPIKSIPKLKNHDFLSFDNMTGNGYIFN